MQSVEERKAKQRAYYHANKDKYKAYQQTEKGRLVEKLKEANRWQKRKHTAKYKCRRALREAINAGKITRGTCHCGEIGDAHHDDYDKPFEVVWLCKKHHREEHKKNKEPV